MNNLPPKSCANTDGSGSLKLRKTLKVTARPESSQGQAQGGSIPTDPDLEGHTAFLFLPLGTPPGLGPTGSTALSYLSISFISFLLLVQDQTDSQPSLGAVVSGGIKISQQQAMCCTWMFLRVEFSAQNKAVINTVNCLQEAGPVSQHLLHLPAFILAGKNPSRAGSLGFLTEVETGFRREMEHFISPKR